MNYNLAQLAIRFENLIRIGTIAEVDEQARKLRVKSGKLLTQWLDWPAEIGRNFIQWRPLAPDIQVVIACISGDPAQAVIITMLYSGENPTPSTNPELDLIQFNDGSLISYDSENKHLTITSIEDITINAGKNCTLNITDNFALNAKNISMTADAITIDGPVEQTGGDMTSDGVSAQHHKHKDVTAGTAQTGEPA